MAYGYSVLLKARISGRFQNQNARIPIYQSRHCWQTRTRFGGLGMPEMSADLSRLGLEWYMTAAE